MKLSDQEKKILLALGSKGYYSPLSIHSLIKMIDISGIKRNWKTRKQIIDVKRYPSFHRSLKSLIRKGLINKRTKKDSKGWIVYYLLDEGKNARRKIIKEFVSIHKRIYPFVRLISKINHGFDYQIYVLGKGKKVEEDFSFKHTFSYESNEFIGVFDEFKKAYNKILEIESECDSKYILYNVWFEISIYEMNRPDFDFVYECRYDLELNRAEERFDTDNYNDVTYREINFRNLKEEK